MRWVESRLSSEKMPYAYAWKTLMREGIHVAGGSDAPIEHPSPLRGIFDSIKRSNIRRKKAEEEEKIFRPEECLSFSEALWIYTHEGAYAAGYEEILGEIKVGSVADLLVIDASCLSNPEILHDLQPTMVLVGGKIEFLSNANNEIRFLKDSSLPEVPPSTSSYKQTIDHEAPFIPGKNGQFTNSKSNGKSNRKRNTNTNANTNDNSFCSAFVQIGYCSCQLKSNYCF